MNCAVCGKDNQPGTRFCVHCGASLAAAQAPAARPAPAPSPHSTTTVPARPAPAAAAMPPLGVNDTGGRTAANPAAPPADVPAYEAEPRGGGGKILLAIGVAALVIAGGFVGYKIFGGAADVKDSFARFDTTSTPRSDSPASPPSAPAPAKEPAPEAATPAAPAAEPAKSDEKDKEKAPAKTEPSKADGAKGDAAKSPADADKAKATTPKGEGKGTKGGAGAATAAPGTPGPAAPAPAARPAPPAPAPVAPAPVAPVQDRWAQMSEELQRCQKENLFNRIVCDQRVRLRFCDGYWGKVSQCPGNVVNPDRGQ